LAVPKDLTKELYWLNYFVDGEFVLDAKTFPHQQQFHDWVVKNLNEVRLALLSQLSHFC